MTKNRRTACLKLKLPLLCKMNWGMLTRVMYKAVLGLHYKRQEQKQAGQLAIF
jgi:hypothetical protein